MGPVAFTLIVLGLGALLFGVALLSIPAVLILAGFLLTTAGVATIELPGEHRSWR